MRIRAFPFVQQLDSNDCGLACVRMIAQYYGKKISAEQLSQQVILSGNGLSLSDLKSLAESIGFKTLYAKTSYEKVVHSAPMPAIAYWNQDHYVVIYKITRTQVHVADPSFGRVVYTKEEFLKGWSCGDDLPREEGVTLLLEPTTLFSELKIPPFEQRSSIPYLLRSLMAFKTQLLLISIGLAISSLLDIFFPFITQQIVDKGIKDNNSSFLWLAAACQMALFTCVIGIQYVQEWLFTHVSSRLSLQIISDFLGKLMRLPMSFFSGKQTGDLIQRIQDHKNVEKFITSELLKSVFAVVSIMILSAILGHYSKWAFIIFIVGSFIEVGWILFFLKKIRLLEQKSFALLAQDQSKIFELITSMQEIKLHNLEDRKQWEWERVQTAMFKVNVQKLSLQQKYEAYRFFSYLQTVLIILVSALAIVNKQMTLGALMSIIYILGRLSTPVGQLINFILSGQLAKVSLERLGEVYHREDEGAIKGPSIATLSHNRDIELRNVSFSYGNDTSRTVLTDVSLMIPAGKVTAIVGKSGSGKTTLLKLLLKFYSPQKGDILLGNEQLNSFDNSFLRSQCGTVMQDSVIFSDTIAYNIALDDVINTKQLAHAVEIANIGSFINDLPLKYNTKVGQNGMGLSQGQRQRILIARAVYKNPSFLFFDEATNSLDAENESIIVKNLDRFFEGKTVIVVAHRLSTVSNADQIIVLDNGRVVEQGNHQSLIAPKGKYFQLVKNQLELGQ